MSKSLMDEQDKKWNEYFGDQEAEEKEEKPEEKKEGEEEWVNWNVGEGNVNTNGKLEWRSPWNAQSANRGIGMISEWVCPVCGKCIEEHKEIGDIIECK